VMTGTHLSRQHILRL
jgi:hypothetical protein